MAHATKTLTLSQIAYELGVYDRLSTEATLPLHQTYVAADKAQQAEMRRDFMIQYVAGNLHVDATVAAVIVAEGRGEHSKNNAAKKAALSRGSNKMNTHLTRTQAKKHAAAKRPSQNTAIHLKAVERDALKAFIEACGSVERAVAVFTRGSVILKTTPAK